jgi:hypothetical protein
MVSRATAWYRAAEVYLMFSRSVRFSVVAVIVMCCFSSLNGVCAATSTDGTLSFSSSTYSGTQNGGSITVTVTRTGGAADAAHINYLTSGHTALLDVDYVHTAGTLTWASGDSSAKTIKVPLINGTAYSGTKNFYLTLSDATGAAAGSPSVATLVITGDGTTSGALEFAAPTYTVAQNTASIKLSVARTGASSGAASVAYLTSGNTALLGVDYVHTAGTLSWASGDATPKSITVPLINRAAYAGSKSFYVTLSNLEGATAGKPLVATLTINGTESSTGSGSPGVIALSASTYAVKQNAGSLTVTVNRTGGSSGAASVGYATGNSTAVAGTNYTAESGHLTWASGDATAKTFSVPVSNATPFTGSKAFAVALASASGATLGTPASGIVTINGDGTTAPTTGSATLLWAAPTENTNGTPLTNLAGYRINYGMAANSLTNVITINSATTTNYEITNLAAGTWYFTIQAYNTEGVDSSPSVSASKAI